jgi:hypothetical protein
MGAGRALVVLVVVVGSGVTAGVAQAAEGAWRETAPMTEARVGHAAGLLPDGRVLVTGGQRVRGTGAALTSAEAFHPASESWAPVAPMLAARRHHTATVLDGATCHDGSPPDWCGTVLVTGTADQAERYLPDDNRWVPAGTTAPRTFHSATALPDGRVLVAGGTLDTGERVGEAEVYDPDVNEWSPAGDLNDPRIAHAATLLPSGRVMVAGGLGSDRLATVEVWEPTTGAWELVPGMTSPRYDFRAVTLPTGAALLVGGTDGITYKDTVEIHDGQETPIAAEPLFHQRSLHTATELTDGRILVAGGHQGTSRVPRSEVWGPDATWRRSGSLQNPRFAHVAVRLQSGLVLIAGGTGDGANNAMGSAELFDPAATPVPGRVNDLAAGEATRSTVELSFRAVGTDGRAPPAARRYLFRQSERPIETLDDFARARPLCGGACEFEPGGVGTRVSLSLTDLRPGTTYHWAVRAQGPDGRLGPLSNNASAATLPGPPPVFSMAIGDLVARALGARSLLLTFTAPGPVPGGVPTEYLVRQAREPIDDLNAFGRARALCGGVCRFPATAPGDRLRLRVDELRPATAYHYAVRARGPDGTLGPLSNPTIATTDSDRIPPGAVWGMTARALSPRKIRLRFRVPASDGSTGPPVGRFDVRQARRPITSRARFRKARRLCKGGCRLTAPTVGARVRLTVTRLCPATRYHYAVVPVDEGGNRGARSRFSPVRTKKSRLRCRR